MYTALGAGKFLVMRRIFARNFPNLPKKFCGTLPTNFLHSNQRSWRPFFGVTSKKVFMCFLDMLGSIFLKSNNVGRHFCPNFQRFCPDFWQIKTFGGALAPPNTIPLVTWMCVIFSSVTFYLSICTQIVAI